MFNELKKSLLATFEDNFIVCPGTGPRKLLSMLTGIEDGACFSSHDTLIMRQGLGLCLSSRENCL